VQVAVFDTAFHQTLPEHAFRYAIPEKFYTEDKIRVYGFHGTSHKYVYNEAKKYLKNDKLKAITIHLGNGSSMAAIDENGNSIDTSLGFGPLCGLVMGTRSGDIDPSVIFHMIEQLNMPLDKIKNVLNKESGMLGLAGSSDARDVAARYHEGDRNAALTFEMYGYRIRKYIGAYMAALNGVDALIFTAGLGENSVLTRSYACKNLNGLGIELDEQLNIEKNHADAPVEIQTVNSKVKILIVPTNEEWQIAKEVSELVKKP
jgi:acetate kinase